MTLVCGTVRSLESHIHLWRSRACRCARDPARPGRSAVYDTMRARRVFVVGETHRSWNEIPPSHMHSSTRASDPEHTPPQEKEGEVASHTARAPPTIHVAVASAPSTGLRRSALLRARLSPPHGPHAALARTLAASQVTPSLWPYGRSDTHPPLGRWMSESLISHTHRRPPICAHSCAL